MNSNLSQVFSQRLERAASQTPPEDGATDMATDALSELDADKSSIGGTHTTTDIDDDNDDAYEGIEWTRLPNYCKPAHSAKRSRKSWVWRYGYRLWHRKLQRLFRLYCYCHVHKRPNGFYYANQSTPSIAHHLTKRKASHGVNKNGPKATSRVTMPASYQPSLLAHLHHKGLRVS